MNNLKTLYRLSKVIALLNFSLFNIRHRFKKKLDADFFINFLFFLSIIGTACYIYFSFIQNIYNSLSVIYDTKGLMTLAFYTMSLITTFVCVFGGLNLFCFSKDTEAIRTLPIKLSDIILSKYILLVIMCYLIELILLLPVVITQMQGVSLLPLAITYLSVIIMLPHIIALPIVSIIILCLKTSQILSRSPIITCCIGFLLYFIFGAFQMYLSLGGIDIALNETELLNNLLTILTPFPFFGDLIAIDILFLLIWTFIIPVVAMCTCYFMTKIVFNDKFYVTKKIRNYRKMKVVYHSLPKYQSYLIKEFKIFFRSPVYVVNGLFVTIIAPFLLPISFQMGTDAENITQVRELIRLPQFSFYSTLFAIGVIVFTSAISVISSSSFSREGKNYWIMKVVPFNYANQAFAKATFGVLVSTIITLLNVLIFKFYFGYSYVQILIIFIVSILFCILWNLLGVLVDMINPKLTWTNESEAIKQNVNVLVGSLICVSISVGYFFFTDMMIKNTITPMAIILILSLSVCIFSILVCKGIAYVAKKQYNFS